MYVARAVVWVNAMVALRTPVSFRPMIMELTVLEGWEKEHWASFPVLVHAFCNKFEPLFIPLHFQPCACQVPAIANRLMTELQRVHIKLANMDEN